MSINQTEIRLDFNKEIESLGNDGFDVNNECVHERKGIYLNPDFSSPHAQLFVG